MNPKKVLSRALLGLNALLILGLLAFSGLLLYFSNAGVPSLFGYQALLQNSAEEGARLILYRPGQLPGEGGQALLQTAQGEVALGTEVRVDSEGFLVCTLPSGGSMHLDASGPEYLGRVAFSSGFWGRLFAAAAAPNQIAITYTAIVVGFLVCILVLAILYLTSSPRPPALPEGDTADGTLEEPPGAVEKAAADPLPALRPLRTTSASALRDSPFQQTPVTRRRVSAPDEEDVKIYLPHSAPPRENPYAAPHILRPETPPELPGRVEAAPVPEPASVPEPAPEPRPLLRREPDLIIQERAGDPYDLYDVGPSIDELLRELEKLE